MNATERIRSRRVIMKYKLKPFVHSMIVSVGVSDFSFRANILMTRYIAIDFSSILGAIAKKFSPLLQFQNEQVGTCINYGQF